MANQPVINNFNAGELSPYLYARNDLAKYNNGCLELENFQILPYGGATRRPAIEFIAATKNDDKVRLISFEFSSTQTYVLELGNLYMRVWKPDDHSAYKAEVVTPFLEAELYDIKFVQSADVMWLTHPNHPPQRLERTSDTSWAMADAVFDFPALLEDNTGDITITPSAVTGSGITLTASDDLFDANHVGSFWTIRHVRNDNMLKALAQTDIDAQNNPPKPTGSNWITGRGTISFTTTGRWYDGYDSTPESYDLAIWRSDDEGSTWEKFRQFNMQSRNVDTSWEEDESNVRYAVTGGDNGKVISPDDNSFRMVINEFYTEGIVKITGYTSATEVTADVINDLGGTGATTRWTEGAWSDYRGFPQAVALFEQRLCFASTLYNPNTIWLSKTDDYQNMELGVFDTDAIKITLGSGLIDEIRWMIPQRPLIIGTVGSEWVLEAESDNKPVTATSFALRRKTTYGSKNLQGTLVNSAVLFVMRQGRKLREFTYRFDVDDYVAPDMTILSEHITKGGITNIAYQQQPDNVLLAVREDGTMIPMTYERDQEVTGWYRWTLNGDGEFESVAVIPKDNAEDQVWVSAMMTIDGVTKRYIGRFDDREWGTDVATEWNGSDFYTVFDSPASTTLTGLDYLEGKTVDIIRDGMVEPQKVVDGGEIVIEKVGDRVVVGVPYDSTMSPIYIEPKAQFVQPMGKKKGLFKAVIRFKDTIHAKVGQTLDDLQVVKFRRAGDSMDTQVSLFNGQKKISFNSEYELLHTCYIKQDNPLPITVIAMIPNVEVHG